MRTTDPISLCTKCDNAKGGRCTAQPFVPENARRFVLGEMVLHCALFSFGRRRTLREEG